MKERRRFTGEKNGKKERLKEKYRSLNVEKCSGKLTV